MRYLENLIDIEAVLCRPSPPVALHALSRIDQYTIEVEEDCVAVHSFTISNSVCAHALSDTTAGLPLLRSLIRRRSQRAFSDDRLQQPSLANRLPRTTRQVLVWSRKTLAVTCPLQRSRWQLLFDAGVPFPYLLVRASVLTIRKYDSSDQKACRSLWAEMVERHREIYDDPSIGGDDPGLEFDQHLNTVGREHIWVAESGGTVVGLVSLIVCGEQAEVEPMVVASSHRGAGIGRELVSHVIEEAKRLGVLCLCVKPVARNEEAISFFYDAGFRTLGHIQLFRWLGESFPGQWKRGPELFGKKFDY